MRLIDDDLLAVDDEYELIGAFVLLEYVVEDGLEVVLILELQVALALVLRVVSEPRAPRVAIRVGLYLNGGDVLAGED